MKRFIKNYIDIFDCMGTSEEEKIDCIIDTYVILKSRDIKKINEYVIKPLIQEYREADNKITLEDIEELFEELLSILL